MSFELKGYFESLHVPALVLFDTDALQLSFACSITKN